MSVCPRFNNLFGIKKMLADDLDGKYGVRTTNRDRVYAICGPERRGKSHLWLHCFEYWFKDLLKVPDYGPEYIKFFASNKMEFVYALGNCPQYGMPSHDEVIKDMYGRNAITEFNKDINVAYAVIGAKNYVTGLILPSILDIDPFFRKRRIMGMFYIYARGRVAFFNKSKLRELIPALERMAQYNSEPNPMRANDSKGRYIRPTFTDSFNEYKGVLLEPYLKRKTDNIQSTIANLETKYGQESEEAKGSNFQPKVDYEGTYREKILEMRRNGIGKKEIRAKLGVNYAIMNKIILDDMIKSDSAGSRV